MTDDPQERDVKSGASLATQRWVERRAEMRAADAADRDKALEMRAEQERHIEQEPDNPVALGLGLLVILSFLIGSWFIINQMRCNPLYSDAGLSRSQACR